MQGRPKLVPKGDEAYDGGGGWRRRWLDSRPGTVQHRRAAAERGQEHSAPGCCCDGAAVCESRAAESLSVTRVAALSGHEEKASPLLRNSPRLSTGGRASVRGGEEGRARERCVEEEEEGEGRRRGSGAVQSSPPVEGRWACVFAAGRPSEELIGATNVQPRRRSGARAALPISSTTAWPSTRRAHAVKNSARCSLAAHKMAPRPPLVDAARVHDTAPCSGTNDCTILHSPLMRPPTTNDQ
jgi:hypothetical protein